MTRPPLQCRMKNVPRGLRADQLEWCMCSNPDKCDPYLSTAPKTPQEVWDQHFMDLAYLWSQRSRDPGEGVGCVLVSPDRRQSVAGYNGTVADHPHELHILATKALKDIHCRHAERNALANAHQDVRGWTAYVTKAPCVECAEDLYSRGIRRVVCPPVREDSRWAPHQKVAIGELRMLGVEVIKYGA